MRKLISKIAGLMLGLSLVVGVGTSFLKKSPSAVNADDTLFYTLTPASGSNNSYAGDCDIAINGITWNLTGNSQMQPWRIGGKNLNGVDRALYSKTAISDDVTKIEVTHGSASSVTVNSWTVIVSSSQDGGGTVVSTLTPTFATNTTTTINRPEGKSWANCYYKFVYNVTIGGSNKFVEFSQAKFYKSSGGGDTPVTYSVTYDSNGATSGTVPTDNTAYESGDTVTVASNSGNLEKTGFTFGGWNTLADGSGTNYASGSGTFNISADTTLYAKWNEESSGGSSNYFEKVTSEANLTAGKYLIVSETDSIAFNGSLATLDAGQNGFSVSISNNKIDENSSNSGKYFTLSVDNSAWTITSASGKNCAHSGTSNGMNGTGTNTISISDGVATILGSGGKGLAYNSASGASNERFRYYTSPASGNNHAVSLFKFTEGVDPSLKTMVIKQSGTAADSGSYAWKSSGSYTFEAYEESTKVTGVTWSVSDSEVAQINSSTGALTTVKPGSVTITAKADGYNDATASITISKGDVSNVIVSGSMTKTTYYVGESWSNAGLTATVNYSSGWHEDVTESATWTYSPTSPALNVTSVTASASFGGKSGSSSGQIVSVSRANPIQVLYTKSASDSVDVYGYYVGFLDGTGPVIMDGAYGIVIYNKTADVSGYTAGTTILHVTGSISIYKGLYEIGSATMSIASGTYDAPEEPVVYATNGSETAEYASRLTTVTGTPSLVSGSFDSAAGTADITLSFNVSGATVQVFYKSAAQTADSDAFTAIKTAVTNGTEITIKGFTGWFNGFQVQMNGYVPAVDSYTAEDFAQDLLDQTDAVCEGYNGVDNNHDTLVAIWSNLASNDKYPSLPSAQKEILAEADRDESGTVVEQAMARYDYLTGKYNLSNFINGRTPVAFAPNSVAYRDPANNNSSTIVIVVVALTSITSIGVLLVIKRKRSLVK